MYFLSAMIKYGFANPEQISLEYQFQGNNRQGGSYDVAIFEDKAYPTTIIEFKCNLGSITNITERAANYFSDIFRLRSFLPEQKILRLFVHVGNKNMENYMNSYYYHFIEGESYMISNDFFEGSGITFLKGIIDAIEPKVYPVNEERIMEVLRGCDIDTKIQCIYQKTIQEPESYITVLGIDPINHTSRL
jgi:hypothetical protein